MTKDRILIIAIIILSSAVITDFVFAQSQHGQWPPAYINYSTPSQSRYPTNQGYPQMAQWGNNYVSQNYNPYARKSGFQVGLSQNNYYLPAMQLNNPVSAYSQISTQYFPMQALPMFPIYGNAIPMPQPFMTYNPLFTMFSGMPPMMPFPTWSY